jgi:hypothetical protein
MSSALLQIATSLVWGLPGVVVVIVGIVLAIGRWQRHPAVSSLLAVSLATMLICWIAFRVAVPILVAHRSGTSVESISVLFGALAILMALVRTLFWGALVAAVFGWRHSPIGSPPAPLQFSIRGLIVVTFAVAVLCALGRALVGYLGEAAPALVQFVDDLPLVVCLGIGIWIAAARWQRHPAVSHLAVWAFALAIALSIVPQLVLLLVVFGQVPIGASPWFYSLLTFTVSLVSATSWALAIAAALGWRQAETAFGTPDRNPTIAGDTFHARHP